MPKSSLKLLVASFFTLLAIIFGVNAPFASASPTITNTSNYSSDDDHSNDDNCEDDDSASENSSKLNKNLSKKSSKSSKSEDKNRKNDDRNKKNDDDDDDDESCGGGNGGGGNGGGGNGGGGNGGGGNGGGGNGGGVGTLVPLTLATPAISSCTTSANLSWVATVSPGYAAVDNYQVRYSSDNGVTWTAYATQTAATTLTLTGLTAGTTYLFQVAAHNVNGWGAWSASTTGCTITSPVPTTARFTFSGSDTFIFDYQDPTGPVRTVVFGGTGLGSGDVATGVYAYDLYISVPIGTYTVTVNGVPFLGSAFSAASVVGLNKPASFSDPLMMGDYSFLQTYGFTITPGSVIAIVIV